MNLREAGLHLRALFQDILNNKFIEIRIIKKTRSKCFFFSSIEDTISWLKNNSSLLEDYNVYVGVNPRTIKPEKCGTSEHVDTAQFLFADKDYKEEVDPPEEVKREVEKKGYYGGDGYIIAKRTGRKGEVKYEKVFKPKQHEFERWLKEKLEPLGIDLDHVLIIDSGNGYHVYVKIDPIPIDTWRPIQELFVKYMEGDPQTKDPARILRLAGTVNNRYEGYTPQASIVRYPSEFKRYDPQEVHKKLKELLEKKKKKEKKVEPKPKKEISKDTISKLIDVLKPYYVVGYRHNICLYLAGLLRKLGYSFDEAKKVIEEIATAFNDEELKDRIKAVETTFERGLEDIAGSSGLEDVFEKFFIQKGFDEEDARDRALEVINKIKDILSAPDIEVYTVVSVYETVDRKGNKLYGHKAIVNDTKRGILIVNTWSNPRRVKVFDYYIKDLTVYINPHDSKDKVFTVVFASPDGDTMRFEEVRLSDLVNMLKNVEGVYNYSKLHDCLSALFRVFMKKGIAKIEPRVPATGFFEVDGELAHHRPQKTQ